jgi:hypothetical protein
MAWYILIALAIALAIWYKWGRQWYYEYQLRQASGGAVKAVEGATKVYGDVVNTAGELIGVANSLTHGGGNFFSRATGAFSQVVGG